MPQGAGATDVQDLEHSKVILYDRAATIINAAEARVLQSSLEYRVIYERFQEVALEYISFVRPILHAKSVGLYRGMELGSVDIARTI